MKLLQFVFILLISLHSSIGFSSDDITADGIVGVWLIETDEEATGKVEIYEQDGLYHGKIIWAKPSAETGEPPLDVKNKKDELKSRPLEGLEIMWDYKFNGVDSWEEGEFYAYKKGRTASPKLTLIDKDHLKIQVKILLFKKTFVWPRVQDTQSGNSSES